jgi:hypothetical protein
MRIERDHNEGRVTEFGKRVYLYGYSIYDDCPKCQKEHGVDLGNHCLSYPCDGGIEKAWLFCEDCHHEWSVKYTFNISLVPYKE